MTDTATAPELNTDIQTETAPSGAPVKSFAPPAAPVQAPTPEPSAETPGWGMGDPFISQDIPAAPAEASPPSADDADGGEDSGSPSPDSAPAADSADETPEPEILRLDGREVDVTGWPEPAIEALKAQDAHHRKVQADRDRAKQTEAAYQKELSAMRAEFEAKLADVAKATPKEPAKPTVTDYDRMIAEATGQEPETVAAAREAATPKDPRADELAEKLAKFEQAEAQRAKAAEYQAKLDKAATTAAAHYDGFDHRVTAEELTATTRNAIEDALAGKIYTDEPDIARTAEGRARIARDVFKWLVAEYNKISNETNGHTAEADDASTGVAKANGNGVSGTRRAAPKAPVKPAATAGARKGAALPAADDLSVDARRARARALMAQAG